MYRTDTGKLAKIIGVLTLTILPNPTCYGSKTGTISAFQVTKVTTGQFLEAP